MKQPAIALCPECGVRISIFRRRCLRCNARTPSTFAERWAGTPGWVRLGVALQFVDALVAACWLVFLAQLGVRGLLVARPWSDDVVPNEHVNVLALGIASVVALAFAVVAAVALAVAMMCAFGLVRRSRPAWWLSVCWLCCAALAADRLRLGAWVPLVLVVQMVPLLVSGVPQQLDVEGPQDLAAVDGR